MSLNQIEPVEIMDFTLIYNGLYWVYYEDSCHPISLSISNLFKLFEVEGIEPNLDDDAMFEYHFKKAVLLKFNYYEVEIFDENNIPLIHAVCKVKE